MVCILLIFVLSQKSRRAFTISLLEREIRMMMMMIGMIMIMISFVLGLPFANKDRNLV